MRTLKFTKIMEPKLIEIVVSDIDWTTNSKNVALPNEVIYEIDLNNLEAMSMNELKEIYQSETKGALGRDYGVKVNGYSLEIRNPNNYSFYE